MKNNCLLVAIASWLKSPQNIKLKVRWIDRTSIPHIYWENLQRGKHYHFAAKRKDLPTYRQLWYEGRVERFYFYGISTSEKLMEPKTATMSNKFFLIQTETVEKIRAHLTEAIARQPSDKNLHEALHQLDTGLNVSDLVPSDFKEKSHVHE